MIEGLPDPTYQLAVALVKRWEGLHRVGTDGLVYPYHDPVGYPTQGYGRLLSRQRGAKLSEWPPIAPLTAERWLIEDMVKAEMAVWRQIKVPLTYGQLAALISFVFNLGAGNLQVSTLHKKINRGDMAGAADEFPRWVYAGSVKLRGLVNRRADERSMFLS